MGGSLTTGAVLLLLRESMLSWDGPDLSGFAAVNLGLGLGDTFLSAIFVSLYLILVLTLRGLLLVQFVGCTLLDQVKCSPAGRSEAAVGGTL